MATKFPYVASAGPIVAVFTQLRDNFPEKVTSATLQKWALAPKNESYVLSVLRFLGLIDAEGSKSKEGAKPFLEHDNGAFAKALEPIVKKSYKELFDLYADKAWTLDTAKLISFFRQAGESTAVVGRRQAGTFQALASLAGHGDPVSQPRRRNGTQDRSNGDAPKKPKPPQGSGERKSIEKPPLDRRDLGFSVRIELNLPAGGDKATYDAIFRSIRENLING